MPKTTKKSQGSSSNVNLYVKRFWIIVASMFLFFILLFTLLSLGWLGFMPSFEELENPKSNLASEIYTADQQILGKYYIENRSNCHYSDLSPALINALIATEDARFEKHSGVDTRSIFRVLGKTIIGRNRSSGGGSTITQQLAKNLFPRDKNQFKLFMVFTKFKEWIVAAKLERNYTKEEIIAMYFNTVDFGSNSFGIKTAARTYFNKSPDSLKIEEAALLVGILKAPTYYSPVKNPENAMKRREVVLNQMRKNDYITQEQYDSLRVLPIDMSRYTMQDHSAGIGTYFREYLRQYLNEWCTKHKKQDGTPYNLYKDGLKIYTTINYKMQKYAEEAVAEHLGKELQPAFYKHWKGVKNAPFSQLTDEEIEASYKSAMKNSDRYRHLKDIGAGEDDIQKEFHTPVAMRIFTWQGERDTIMSPYDSLKYYKWFLHTGLMSMEPQTGYVRAYVGGINYKHFQFDNVKTGRRQVGSTFKPFVYTLAMQEGEFSPCTEIPNLPVTFDMGNGESWTPQNADDKREGEMVTLKWALANSINNVSAYLMKRFSPAAVINMARKMGITSPIDAVPAICLGTPDLSVYEMTGAMSAFANKGVFIEPIFITRIEDKNGNVLENFIPKQQEAMSEVTAYLMIELMKGVVESGTGVRLRYKYGLDAPIAGKTGTTQNNSDGWFMGVTPSLTTGVWVGGEVRSIHFRNINLGQGANMALPIWALYMKKVWADKSLNIPKNNFDKPAQDISDRIDCKKFNQEIKNEKKEFDFSDKY
ncbi:MAG: transglycosylase domain-containing protein [Bacteroidetes bacterium]|nr:transglycosylase domain-containing protein [Bacteroidota bacterium]